MSPAEGLLWQYLRGKPAGVKFRRQHPIDPYVVDFYCPAAKLIVELDGQIHEDLVVAARDLVRAQRLEAGGHRIVRVTGAEVFADAHSVADRIVALALAPLHHRFAAVPLSACGEEQE